MLFAGVVFLWSAAAYLIHTSGRGKEYRTAITREGLSSAGGPGRAGSGRTDLKIVMELAGPGRAGLGRAWSDFF